jgi:hypothetical protein
MMVSGPAWCRATWQGYVREGQPVTDASCVSPGANRIRDGPVRIKERSAGWQGHRKDSLGTDSLTDEADNRPVFGLLVDLVMPDLGQFEHTKEDVIRC